MWHRSKTMFDRRKTLHDGGILDVINILSTNRESGRLDMRAGPNEGTFFIKNGLLVAARLGHLSGFQAINAAASMRDARFFFDPSVVPPSVSSITPSERVVLKQFFGIETIDPEEPLDDDEVTIETNALPVQAIPTPAPDTPSSRSYYRGGLILAVLFLLIAVSAVVLRNRYRERIQTPSIATTTQQPQQQPVAAPQATEGVKDLTGRWNVVNTVQKTSYRSYQHLKIGFDLSISQNGKTFTGKGEKVSENGRTLPAGNRTPIHVEGSIDGDRIEATFFEQGAVRKTTGRFVWKIDETGGLNGTFASSAANSSGKSAARKSS